MTGTNPEVIVGNYWAHKMKSTEALGINRWQLAKMKKSIPDMSLP